MTVMFSNIVHSWTVDDLSLSDGLSYLPDTLLGIEHME